MKHLYNAVIFLLGFAVHILAVFDRKLALFVNGRKKTFGRLASSIGPDDQTIWIHCASLGEFEQGRPIIEKLGQSHPGYKIVLSFYSPSGYEVRKDYKQVDVVVYLPLDSRSNSNKFIEMVHPSLAVFVKYEFWPNILGVLKDRSIPTILVSGIFRTDQVFFKPYGTWMKKSLAAFTHFFVQNQNSKQLLENIGYANVTISGDTRFDRVASILEQNNTLDFLENFVKDRTVMVAGSTWPVDENYLLKFINQNQDDKLCFIIAPHNINPKEIKTLKKALNCKTSLYSEGPADAQAKVFIADTIGLLTRIYSYADLAYVGGGFDKEGVHNVLEPAVFFIPLVIGPVYDKFDEAKQLVELGGCLVAETEASFNSHLNKLIIGEGFRKDLGKINGTYIKVHQGATRIILEYINRQLPDIS